MKEDIHSGSVRIVMLLCWLLSLAILVIEVVYAYLSITKELDAAFLILWLVLEAESILKLKKKIAQKGFGKRLNLMRQRCSGDFVAHQRDCNVSSTTD